MNPAGTNAVFLSYASQDAVTQARREGYFRLEWKLADDRTHLMAKDAPFLLPVCVDDTKDWGVRRGSVRYLLIPPAIGSAGIGSGNRFTKLRTAPSGRPVQR